MKDNVIDFWNYKSDKDESTGYEDVKEELSKYTKDEFDKLTDENEKIRYIDNVFNIYRSKNIFPIQYYNEKGMQKEIKKCIDKDVSQWDGKVLDIRANQGSSLCKYIFPNLHKVECKGVKNNSMYDRFYDDHKLKRAIKLSLSIKKGVSPSEIRTSLELIGGNVATNFKIMNAKALYEKYCPVNGVIYDFACGFGGRMLGALSSKNNYTYYGVEPCSETYEGLLKLGDEIEKVTNRKHSFEIVKAGSEENITDRENFVDFAFSSPPYFTLEKYSDEDTQCYIKYPTIESWFIGYVIPTIENIYKYLKDGAYYGVNIADFKVGNREIKFVDEWIKVSKIIGFEYVENIPMKLVVRKGAGHEKDEKKEGIFIFRKPIKESNSLTINDYLESEVA